MTGIGEIAAGDDLAAIIAAACTLVDGDILVVTSKVVSKAEGRVRSGEREDAVAQETDRLLARRGATAIVRTRHGLVLAAAGVDASNTPAGTIVLLPVDPDGSARALREQIGAGSGPNVAVVVSDTLGRAWRNGQTDVAVGAAGLEVLVDLAGEADGYGNRLEVTEPAVADEIAGAADLVTGKLTRAPAAVVRGLAHLVTAPGEHGPGARALARDEREDMFGYGAREAVVAALGRGPDDGRGFGTPAGVAELSAALRRVCPRADVRGTAADDPPEAVDVLLAPHPEAGSPGVAGGEVERLVTVAFAMGWVPAPPPPAGAGTDVALRFLAATP